MVVGVTGAAGHIGTAICGALIDAGYEVLGLIHRDSESLKDLPVKIFEGDILSPQSVALFAEKCDYIVHAAGIIELGYRFSRKVYDINFLGTKHVLEAAKKAGVKRVIHLSSIHAYRQKPYDLPLDESRDFVTDRSLFYDQTKRDSHQLAINAFNDGQDVIIVAPTSVLGPPDTKPSKLGKAIIDIYKGYVPAAIKGGFDFADVRDVAKAVVAALIQGRAGATYLLGGKYYSVKELGDFVLEVKEAKKRLVELPLWMAYIGLPFIKLFSLITGKPPLYDAPYLDILQDANRKIDCQKAEEDLNLSVRPLKETVTDILQWFKENGRI